MKNSRFLPNHFLRSPNVWTHGSLLALGLACAACGGETGDEEDPGDGLGGSAVGDGDGDGDGDDTGEDGQGTGGKSGTGGSESGLGGVGSSDGGDATGGKDGAGGAAANDTCDADQYVDQGLCVACPSGTTAPAGADVTGGNTSCSPILCADDEFVSDHECSSCPEGSVNKAGDDASGDDTTCEAIDCEQLVNLVPIMSQSEDDFGTAAASGVFDSTYPAWHAFDGTGSLWLSEYEVSPAWLSYEFKTGPEVVEQYAIQYTNGPSLMTRAPKNWKFQGYNGSSWIDLDSRSEETGWSHGEERVYSIASPSAYFNYRLHVSEDNDDREDIITVSIGQMKLLGSPCTTN